MSGETPGRTTIKWLNIGEHHAVVCWPPIVLRSFRGARTEQSARSRLLTSITLTGSGLLAGDPTLRSATPPTCLTSPTFRNYISTRVAGKFPSKFGGFAAAFEGVFPSMPRSLPLVKPPSYLAVSQIDLPSHAPCNHYLGTRNSHPSEPVTGSAQLFELDGCLRLRYPDHGASRTWRDGPSGFSHCHSVVRPSSRDHGRCFKLRQWPQMAR